MKKTENNIPKKGMNRKTHPSELSNQEYSFALNINIQEGHGDGDLIIVNEPSNIKCSGFKDGYVVVKHKYDRVRNKTYFFLVNEYTGCSEIGWIDMNYVFEGNSPVEQACGCEIKVVLEDGLENIVQESTCEYNTLISDYCEQIDACTGCLGFSLHSPITDVVIRHSQRGDELYFTDGDKPQRYVKVDKIDSYFQDIDDCTGDVTETCLDCEKLRIFNLYDYPCMSVETIQNGGSLKAGVYEIVVAYSDINGNEFSDYLSLTNPVSIFDSNKTILDQTSLDYPTTQSFSVAITGLDLNYDYYRVVVISRTGNDPAPVYTTIGMFPTSQSQIVITSLPKIREEIKEVTSYDILNRRPLYLTAKGLSEVNGYMFQHGLTNQRTVNLQPVVSLMGAFVKWGTVEALEKLYKDGTNSAKYKGYMRGEVVPLSIQFKMRGGHKTHNFVFVARPPMPSEIAQISEDDLNYLSITEAVPDCAKINRNKVWQFLDTSTSEDITCLNANPLGEIDVEEVHSCTTETTLEVTNGSFPYSFDGGIASYIQNNLENILASSEPELSDLIEVLTSDEYGECTPIVPDNCDVEPILLSEEVVVIESSGEQIISVPVGADEYLEVLSPISCNNTLSPLTPNLIVESALPVGSTVNQKTPPVNISCATAIEIANLVVGTANPPYHLDDASQIGSNSTLLSNIDVSLTSSVFNSKLHTNAIFFKVSSFTSDLIALQLSKNICTFSDSNTNNSVRVTFFDGCPTLNEVSSYGEIITDLPTSTIDDRLFTLNVSDFPSGVVYMAIDSPMRSDITFDMVFSGTSGQLQIIIGGAPFLLTYSSNINTTVNNFYTANLATWASMGISATLSSYIISFRMTIPLYNSILLNSIAPNLNATFALERRMYTLQPPCGCISVYKTEAKVKDIVVYDSLVFAKKFTYQYSCSYSQSVVSDCEPSPHKQGLFSYVESTYKYPCNSELYDSSTLEIKTTDLPDSIREQFEDYYVSTINGVDYNLSQNANFMDKPIRHYKFPSNSVAPFMKTGAGSQVTNPDSLIYPMGFVIDNEVINSFLNIAEQNSLITSEERDAIVGYELFRGDRSTERSIIGKGLLFNTRAYTDESRGGEVTHYPNYPLNDLGVDNLNGFYPDLVGTPNSMYTFHSPETHFNKPSLPFEVILDGIQTGYAINTFAPLKDHPNYTILAQKAKNLATGLATLEATSEILMATSNLIVNGASGGLSAPVSAPLAIGLAIGIVASSVFKVGKYRYEWHNTLEQMGNGYNHAYIAASEAKYHNFIPNSLQNSYIRGMKLITYLDSGYKEVTETSLTGQTFYINNFQRESSVLLKTSDDYPFIYNIPPYFTDNTRANIPSDKTGTLYSRHNTTSPYVTLKQFLPSQYNTVNSIQWIHTGYCGNLNEDNTCEVVFGGDTFISRMSLKRKFPFFTETAWKLASGVPFKYSSVFNINNGVDSFRGFIDYKTRDEEFSSSTLFFPDISTRYSLWDGGSWNLNVQGKFYVSDKYKFLTHYFGIPHFLVESEINLNYRYAGLEDYENFYENISDDTISWVQPSKVMPTHDNSYKYNFIYSSRPHRWAGDMLPVNYNREEWDKLDNKESAIIYSQQDDISSSTRSPFLNYKVSDFHNFNKSFGTLIDVKAIESDQVLFRFTDGMIIMGAIDTLRDRITETTKTLGIGGIFNERSVNFNTTELGSAGTQHKTSISTEFGHYWVDAKRGKVYELKPGGQGLSEISIPNDKWFREQLPFKILKTYPEVNIDNAYGGMGISMGWDDRLKRLFITKLDYEAKQGLSYSNDVGFYTGVPTCEEGYELVNGMCQLYETAEKIESGVAHNTISIVSEIYGFQQPALYSQFTTLGAGNIDVLSPTGYTFEYLSDTFWTGGGILADRLTSILGTFTTPMVYNTWVGNTTTIRVRGEEQHHIIVAADNKFRVWLNGVVVIESDINTMGAQHTINPLEYKQQIYRRVHIYPVLLTEGCNTIRIEALNEDIPSPGMLSAAIVKNTALEIQNANSIGDLQFIYSTAEQVVFFEGDGEMVCPEGFEPLNITDCDLCRKLDVVQPNYNVIPLTDEDYFKKAHWTIAYSPLTQTWISYYSFYPNYYNSYTEYFQTGINELGSSKHGIWTHHPFVSSYQVFYGELHPFIVEIANRTQGVNSYMESVQFYLDVRKYYNMYDFSDTFGVGFNKAYIYNNFQNSGLLELKFQQKNDLSQLMKYPKYKDSAIEILQSEIEGKWSFNFLYDSIKNEKQGLPIWNNDNVQVSKEINPLTIDYRAIRRDRIRGDYFLVRLIQDEDSRNKMFFRLTNITRDFYE